MTFKSPRLDSRQRGVRVAIIAAIVFGFLVLAAILRLARPIHFLFGECAFHTLTGLPCAFCGGTRAARCMLHGDFGGALYFNAFAVLLLLGSLLLCAALLLELATRRVWLPKVPAKRRIHLVLFGVLVVFIWWMIHVADALYRPKPEIANLEHPVVRWLSR